MSEYQYYEFLAVDRPLSEQEIRELREVSRRAEITPARFVNEYHFGNLRGGQAQDHGESIQFDSKGVEFGPWLARFVAQVRSNWMIPQAAMSMRGHVAIPFFVHKDGRITDVSVAKPSTVDAFTLSGRNAILTSNPTIPLPAEYPDEKCYFTFTFYFNERPPGQ